MNTVQVGVDSRNEEQPGKAKISSKTKTLPTVDTAQVVEDIKRAAAYPTSSLMNEEHTGHVYTVENLPKETTVAMASSTHVESFGVMMKSFELNLDSPEVDPPKIVDSIESVSASMPQYNVTEDLELEAIDKGFAMGESRITSLNVQDGSPLYTEIPENFSPIW